MKQNIVDQINTNTEENMMRTVDNQSRSCDDATNNISLK